MSVKQRMNRIESKAIGIVRYDEVMARVGIVSGVHDLTHPLYGYRRVVHDDDPESVARLSGFLDALDAFGHEPGQPAFMGGGSA